jgi:hypothetical protein
MKREPVSEMFVLYFLDLQTKFKAKNPMLLTAIHHHETPLQYIKEFVVLQTARLETICFKSNL